MTQNDRLSGFHQDNTGAEEPNGISPENQDPPADMELQAFPDKLPVSSADRHGSRPYIKLALIGITLCLGILAALVIFHLAAGGSERDLPGNEGEDEIKSAAKCGDVTTLQSEKIKDSAAGENQTKTIFIEDSAGPEFVTADVESVTAGPGFVTVDPEPVMMEEPAETTVGDNQYELPNEKDLSFPPDGQIEALTKDREYKQADLAEREKVYKAAHALIQSKAMEELFKQEGLIFEEPSHEYLWFHADKFDRVRKKVLKTAGLSWKSASPLAREAATAIVFEQANRVHQKYYQYWDHIKKIKDSKKFFRLVGDSMRGFDDLSNEHVFLDARDMQTASLNIIKENYPREDPSVHTHLAQSLSAQLIDKAAKSKDEFTLCVHYIIYGAQDFGTRDRFLPYQTFAERQTAIVEAIYDVLKKHPQYKNIILAPFVKEVVAEQAQKLAEVIQNVPPPS